MKISIIDQVTMSRIAFKITGLLLMPTTFAQLTCDLFAIG